jgi:hypothetical protein
MDSKRSSQIARSAKTGQFVLTSKRGEKFSAVEGLKLSERMCKVVQHASTRVMSGDERRALVKETLRKK